MRLGKVTEGDTTLAATETTLNTGATKGNGFWWLHVNYSALVASDVVKVRAYTKVRSTGTGNTLRMVAEETITGLQDSSSAALHPHKVHGPWQSHQEIEVRVIQTAQGAGGLKAIHWTLLRG